MRATAVIITTGCGNQRVLTPLIAHSCGRMKIKCDVMRAVVIVGLAGLMFHCWVPVAIAQQETELALLERSFVDGVRPLLNRYCVECHAGDDAEAEIDLGTSRAFDDLGSNPELWLKVREVLNNRQMPPEDAQQPTATELVQLNTWVHSWLKNAAKAQAGDPGPVILRRLSNAEYNYTIQDLTGVDSLHPTLEFPVDGAAGEGFTNSGAAQGMSPALVTKYLDAAHDVARHAVLLPDGIRFSLWTSRRDHSDELLARIQDFYRRFTDDGGGMPVDLQGIKFDTNQGGLLPLARYLQATVEHRDDLASGKTTLQEVAEERSLNPQYLGRLWHALTQDDSGSTSFWLSELQTKWKAASVDDVPALVAGIEQIQKSLWRFNSVGQIGRFGGPASWMEAVSPVVASQELSLPLSAASDRDFVLYLTASVLGDGNSDDFVEWQQPRLEFTNGRPPILLRDVRSLSSQIESLIASESPATTRYLDAVRELRSTTESIDAVAKNRNLNPQLLKAWSGYVGLGPANREIQGHLTERIENVGGFAAIHGWGSPQTPSLLSNRSEETITFSTLTLPPRSVFVHPSPALESVVAWRSPLDGQIKLQGTVADADNNCGNGIQWSLQRVHESGVTIIDQGGIDNANQQTFSPSVEIEVRHGDVIALVVNPRGQDHSCDTTMVDLTLSEVGGEKRVWNLATDVVDRVHEGNPLADSYGNKDTWHFCARPVGAESTASLPVDSAIARWRAAVIDSKAQDEIQQLAISIQQLMTTANVASLSDGDRELRQQLLAWNGPLHWLDAVPTNATESRSAYGLDSAMFGRHPDGTKIDAANLCLQAPQIVEIKLPAQLISEATFRTTGTLHAKLGAAGPVLGGSVQLRVLNSRPKELPVSLSEPIIANPGPALEPLEKALRKFRELFPPALCYARIVPVDEAVTLTLYFREDSQLQRLMLDDEQSAELDRLWDQLYFVSQEPILLTTAFEQISEFATQDRPDLVTAFAPMRKSIYDRADAFRVRLLQAESSHVRAVQQFARRAWRRLLNADEEQKIQSFYQELRGAEIPHDEAIELVLARVLTSPAFLFKLEQVSEESKATPVSQLELASRLSYFLWSSLPDEPLSALAESGQLSLDDSDQETKGNVTGVVPEHAEFLRQTRRMLQDPRTRRLAIQFACQWLHVRNFDQNNDKNEQLYPEFSELRHDMYEETVRFFEDMFRNDGSILDLIDGDHAFMNQRLAKHYGIEGVSGSEWQKINGMRTRGRGGILGMATVLASQSGASRTSPILRGVWVSETLLGERLPRPPANVPKLPETVPDGLTARQLIELHSGQPECAKCHVRIDPYGFALEQFDAIGRLRPTQVDTRAELVDGRVIEGIAGMEAYLATDRRDDVVRQFCRKLLGYSLGREVLLSDEPLLDEMQASLQQHGYRFSVAVESIVTSPQFLSIRGRSTGQ